MGPAEGKIRVEASVTFYSEDGDEELPLDLVVYIHLAGYAGATVTHIDLEGPDVGELQEILDLDGARRRYVDIVADGDVLHVWKRGVGELVIQAREKVFGEVGCRGVVGYKEGGVFIGLCAEAIRAVEGRVE